MKFLRTKLIALSFLFAAATTQAQLRLPVTNNDLRNNLQKVIADFPRELNTIKGDIIVENPQTVEYATLLKFEGAESNSITRYVSAKPVYSWQALILHTEDFEEASKKYKWLFNQLKSMTLKMDDGYSFTLNGSYDKPEESRKFCSSLLQLTPAASNLPRLKVEAAMQFEFPEWKVILTVFQREREDHEQGDTQD